MRSVCFFASYYKSDNIPYYVTVYLKELKKHFTEVVLLSSQNQVSQTDLQFLKNENIQVSLEKNEGFDFGLWYKAFQKHDVTAYDKIALVNDSCILFKPLDEIMKWSQANTAELQGITLSDAISPHVQSYFLIIDKKAIGTVNDYFTQHKIIERIEDVILTYEVGLSKLLISKGFSIAAYIDNNGYKGEFSPYYHCVDYHIAKGIPVIKKKIMFSSYRESELSTLARMNFNIDKKHYVELITKYNKNVIIDLKRLENDAEGSISGGQKIKYKLRKVLINLLRPLYKKMKNA